MKKVPFILLMVVIFACDDDKEPVRPYDPSYFPLHVGDLWYYVPASNFQYPYVATTTSEITAKVTIDNAEFYLMISTHDYPDSSHLDDYIDSTYYRLGNNGYVYSLKNTDDRLSNPYRLGALEGEHWKFITPHSDNGKIIVTRIETNTLNNTPIEACKTYYYDDEQWVDEEHYSVLAPGLGIIKGGSAWGFDTVLKRAIIAGKEYQF